ncbi:hypothetical protein OQA88_6003 [Cercophora sp. LCS_1]
MSSVEGSPFPTPKRHITTHTPTGIATFSTTVSSTPTTHSIPGMLYHEMYTTTTSPINIQDESDIKAVKANEPNESTITFPSPGNTILRYCDWPPGGSAPLHRHETIDFGIVIHGSVEAITEDGQTRVLGPGDVLIQRNTMHGWRNVSETEWARVAFVIQGVEPVRVGDKVMTMDLGAFVKTDD